MSPLPVFFKNALSSFLSSAKEKDPIYAGKVQMLYAHIPGAIFPTSIAILVYAFSVWEFFPKTTLVIWCLCGFGTILGRSYLFYRYKQRHLPLEKPEQWFRPLAVFIYLSGAVWGSTAFFLFPESIPHQIFLTFLLAGFTAGAVGIYSIMLEVVVGFTVLCSAPLFVRLLFYNNSLHLSLSVMSPVYWLGLMIVARRIHHAMTTSLKLNIELEEARNMLEVRVTERTAALSTANTQLRKLSKAIEQSVEMVVIMDLDGKIEFVNSMVEKKTGYAASSLLAQPFQGIHKNGNNAASLEQVFQKVLSGEVWHGEVVNQTKVGLSYIADMTMNPIYDEGGEMTHFVAIMRDITEKKALEQELIQASKLSSLGTLVSGIAHELNTPLATILGFSREISQEAGLKPDLKKCADWIVQESERCAVIVRNLLNFSHKNEAETRTFSLNDLLEEILKLFRHQFKTDGIQLKSELAQMPLFVHGDPEQLQQVFVNIIQNARQSIKRVKAKGVVEIKTGFCTLSVENPTDRVQITIKNDGPSIPREGLEKIFDPFYTTKATGEGTGLGLSLSYGIIKAHRGRVWVENLGEVGVCFHLVLPLVEQTLEEGRSFSEGIPTDIFLPKGLRILLVEDDEKFREWLGRFLLREGAYVTEAANGQEALDRLKMSEVDVILSDFKMPGMDGLELCRWIEKERPEYLERFCFLTGIAEAALNHFCKEKRIPILMKPVEKKRLLETLVQIHE